MRILGYYTRRSDPDVLKCDKNSAIYAIHRVFVGWYDGVYPGTETPRLCDAIQFCLRQHDDGTVEIVDKYPPTLDIRTDSELSESYARNLLELVGCEDYEGSYAGLVVVRAYWGGETIWLLLDREDG